MPKMKDEEIQEGKAYVKRDSTFARKVIRIIGDQVIYRAFETDVISYLGTSVCNVGSLARWAERDATPAESAMLDVGRALVAEGQMIETMKRRDPKKDH